MTDYLDMNPDHIAGYLRRHPSFLSDYPDLALALVMPREAGVATGAGVEGCGAARTAQATRAPELPVGSVTWSSRSAWMTRALPSASKMLFAPPVREMRFVVAR